ncbi:uncharacterized protein LOC9662526 isoform X2 [Selaginella moellendorffii]|uniref:uncharacterized protein LOC9662526 isoform X2 n=1 Tax=Selaginella moellendorffii TaxID=88036 RepID=UPI000D1C876A|nr:uncharacterized protein LOC9662526 isoform X2 [Selaginella moellendorffii]|eukprot:XP_024542350.1 uncharacterized protein LOC9662526 isoform X2 [Selaginella moellendorffii]
MKSAQMLNGISGLYLILCFFSYSLVRFQCRVTKCVKIALLYLKVREHVFSWFGQDEKNKVGLFHASGKWTLALGRNPRCAMAAVSPSSIAARHPTSWRKREMDACYRKKFKAPDDRSESGKTCNELQEEVAAHHRKISQQQEFEQEVICSDAMIVCSTFDLSFFLEVALVVVNIPE